MNLKKVHISWSLQYWLQRNRRCSVTSLLKILLYLTLRRLFILIIISLQPAICKIIATVFFLFPHLFILLYSVIMLRWLSDVTKSNQCHSMNKKRATVHFLAPIQIMYLWKCVLTNTWSRKKINISWWKGKSWKVLMMGICYLQFKISWSLF